MAYRVVWDSTENLLVLKVKSLLKQKQTQTVFHWWPKTRPKLPASWIKEHLSQDFW